MQKKLHENQVVLIFFSSVYASCVRAHSAISRWMRFNFVRPLNDVYLNNVSSTG